MQVHQHLQQRAAFRRRRHSANLRYRAPRFANRRRAEGWLAPSLRSRVDNVLAWTARLLRWAPVARIALETVRFDTQWLQSPEIVGVKYQQGTLAAYELREYLLEKWGRQCAYCGASNVPLQIEHVIPLARGGSDRVSNLTLACGPCNQGKGALPVQVFLAHDPARLARLLAQVKQPLRDAAAVNATRWALYRRLRTAGLPVEVATGGRTKWNRTRLRLPKAHVVDALCVGVLGEVIGWHVRPLRITAAGRGSYQRTRLTRDGFPRGYLARQKTHYTFRTGDLVRAVVPGGQNRGAHVGRVAVRARPRFVLQLATGRVEVAAKTCRLLQRADGYAYTVSFAPSTQ